jgi:H+/Na+-translocating ferredoxin:NAD+ oxidoreductase subunit B
VEIALLPIEAEPRATPLAERVDALLPQTQCGRCGYAGCRPYADAIADGAPINRCPPGGASLIDALAALTGRPAIALDPACGDEAALGIARVDEARCIGCTLCLEACPVDAIIGAPKRMHAVLAALCTGCGLCVPPCPVDCVAMVPAGRSWSAADAVDARARYARHRARIAASSQRRAPAAAAPAESEDAGRARRREAIERAFARARARRRGAAVAAKP